MRLAHCLVLLTSCSEFRIQSVSIFHATFPWSFSPSCMCVCTEWGIHLPAQTPRARGKWNSTLTGGSRNQTPSAQMLVALFCTIWVCTHTGRSSLAYFRLRCQVYFSKQFKKSKLEKSIHKKTPELLVKKTLTDKVMCIWACFKQLQTAAQPNVTSPVYLSRKLTGLQKWWLLSSFLQKIASHPATALNIFSFWWALSWQDLLGLRGAMAPIGTFWGPKHLLSFTVCSGWHGQGTFHLWYLHTEGVKDFCGGSKIDQFHLYFCTRKIQLTVVSHTQSGKALVAEAAKGDVNLPHIPEP